jgi:hypothetical protein
VIPTYHPAAILRGGGERSRQFGELRQDFELVRDALAALERPSDRVTQPEPVNPPEPVTVPEADPAPEEQLELF